MKSDLLDPVIEHLDFANGQLFDVSVDIGSLSLNDQLDKAAWLKVAKEAGAEKVFFVENNPVIVFARNQQGENEKNAVFNKIWCLSRPRMLFLASEGELSVLDLAQEPIRHDAGNPKQRLKTLETLTTIKDVAQKLQAFHRDHIESGKVFEHNRFGSLKYRADQALMANLKTVRHELIQSGLSIAHAHSLIGRSIFIRYLEDRRILTREYFDNVAQKSQKWQQLLNRPPSRESIDPSPIQAIYPQVLEDKSFTYALFRALATDFNGDMFPNIDEEEQSVDEKHIGLIRDLLYGDVGPQKSLFFSIYRFDIIPLELISAIYEEFYHSSTDNGDPKNRKEKQDGAYYTPPSLAEFVVSRVLTLDVLEKNPRVLDPACGSGIFLVEAFRRMVRYRLTQQPSSPLSFNELKEILGSQIVGIEVNEEAARITAFSLYLAMLHYLEPPSILRQIENGNRLPNLISCKTKSENHYHNLHVANAFELNNEDVGKVDVVVGNPPWGAPGKKADPKTLDRHRVMVQWCNNHAYPIGDEEPSQAFLWRATEFLPDDGRCALLTSTGVLLKHREATQSFRREWMVRVCITEVFNFTHVRKFFFRDANSPFVMIHFKKGEQNTTPVEYWSPKQVIALKETEAVLLSKYDRAYLVNQDLADNKTWKIRWFGRHADADFLAYLNHSRKLENIVDRKKSGQGYTTASGTKQYPDLQSRQSLIIETFDRYSKLEFKKSPEKYYRPGPSVVYRGPRLLIKRGITERGVSKGTISARYETEDFCFANSINGLKLVDEQEKFYLLILGILWSSFSRYFYFNISANWGVWHHEIHLDDELLQLPLPTKLEGPEADRIIAIVKNLREYRPRTFDMLDVPSLDGVPKTNMEAQRRTWETELDEAVFDLYGFSEAERDLIRDCCGVTLPFFYQPYTSVGVELAVTRQDTVWLQDYAERFAEWWQRYLNDGEVLRADLHIGASDNIVAMEFYPADAGDPWNLTPKQDSWKYVLDEIGKALPNPMGTSQILLDGIVLVVTDDSIIVLKRNQKRFWTRSLAREDAESTLVKRMLEPRQRFGGIA